MNWGKIRYLRGYARSSLWMIPFLAIPLQMIATRVLHAMDDWLGWTFLGFAIAGARATLETIVTATLSFVVFTFGSLLVALQVASAQLTPRIIATTLLQNNVVKYTVCLFLFTMLLALSALNRMDTAVHELVVLVTSAFGLASFAAFLFFIDYAARLLRPISILVRVGDRGLAVLKDVYPNLSTGRNSLGNGRRQLGPPERVVKQRGRSGIVLALNLDNVVATAERLNGVIELVPQVGDFVSVDDILFQLYGGVSSAEDHRLAAMVAVGSERTLEQDPAFAFRIVVDIALRALSAAINDPTTAVLAIDQLHRMLRAVGLRQLHTEEIFGPSGELRAIFRTPNWEDFVDLAFSEIRRCGSNNLQIVRRLRAMIGDLLASLPAHRHPALNEQLSLLDREAARQFDYPEELELARIADSQGLGGRSRARAIPGPFSRQ
jgi:uncharacterized membrane protein